MGGLSGDAVHIEVAHAKHFAERMRTLIPVQTAAPGTMRLQFKPRLEHTNVWIDLTPRITVAFVTIFFLCT